MHFSVCTLYYTKRFFAFFKLPFSLEGMEFFEFYLNSLLVSPRIDYSTTFTSTSESGLTLSSTFRVERRTHASGFPRRPRPRSGEPPGAFTADESRARGPPHSSAQSLQRPLSRGRLLEPENPRSGPLSWRSPHGLGLGSSPAPSLPARCTVRSCARPEWRRP